MIIIFFFKAETRREKRPNHEFRSKNKTLILEIKNYKFAHSSQEKRKKNSPLPILCIMIT